MAIDFPASPSVNDTYTANSVVYTWDGTKWTAVTPAGDKIVEGNTSVEVVDTGSDGRVVFNTEGNEVGRFDSSGRFGIGTTPTSILDVRQTNDSGGVTFHLRNASDIGNTTPYVDITATQRSNNADGGRIRFGRDDAYTATTSTMDSNIQFWTAANNLDTERVRISSTGALGFSGANYGTTGQVLTSQGSGAAPQWATPAGGAKYAIIADQKAQATSGGTFTSGDWRTRDLNTEIADPDGIVSISSNQFTLGAGTYIIFWSAPAWVVNRHQSQLYNVTTSSTVAVGTSEYNAGAAVTASCGLGRVTLGSSTAFEIRHRCQTTYASEGFGLASNLTTEQYTVVQITKL